MTRYNSIEVQAFLKMIHKDIKNRRLCAPSSLPSPRLMPSALLRGRWATSGYLIEPGFLLPPSPTGSSFSLGCPPSSPCPHTCPLGDHSLATPNEAGHSYWVDFLRASSVLPFYEWTMSYVIVSLLSCSHSTLDCKLPIDGDSVFTFKPSPPHSEQMPSQGQTHGGGLGVGEWLSAFLDSPSRKACGVVPF